MSTVDNELQDSLGHDNASTQIRESSLAKFLDASGFAEFVECIV